MSVTKWRVWKVSEWISVVFFYITDYEYLFGIFFHSNLRLFWAGAEGLRKLSEGNSCGEIFSGLLWELCRFYFFDFSLLSSLSVYFKVNSKAVRSAEYCTTLNSSYSLWRYSWAVLWFNEVVWSRWKDSGTQIRFHGRLCRPVRYFDYLLIFFFWYFIEILSTNRV